jgi:hypothetical protein
VKLKIANVMETIMYNFSINKTLCTLASAAMLLGSSSAAMAHDMHGNMDHDRMTNMDGCKTIHATYQGSMNGEVMLQTKDGTAFQAPMSAVWWGTRGNMGSAAMTNGQEVTIFQPNHYQWTTMSNQPTRSDNLMAVGSPDGVWFLPQSLLTSWQSHDKMMMDSTARR